ncbi:MAG: hypothetical protein KDA96_15145, partial [Planctomycetaceae bacterium]|nr:hypothetical protein [Planctomycetaceae bacterium]
MADETESFSMDVRSPEGFRGAVNSLTPLKFAEAVSTLTEVERKKLSRTAQDVFREHRSEATERRREFFGGAFLQRQLPMPINPVVELGLLAAAPRSAAVRLMEFRLGDWMSAGPQTSNRNGSQAEQAAIR